MSGSQQPLLGYGASAYRIANSLRFRSSASAYLNRTPGVAGNQKTWTWSGWVKRGTLNSDVTLFSTSTNGTTFFELVYGGGGTYFQIDQYNGSARDLLYSTTALYRDPSSWYHVVVAMDTTQATSTNRVQMWVNGVQITSWQNSTAPSQNLNTYVNATNAHAIGRRNITSPIQYFDGYLADINFIDGQALTPSSFGAFNATTGVWGPIAYTGTYGTNGFKLNFSNGTSTTTLGYDSSGNGNNWTTNNISLTAGSTYDWMIDSPTPFQGSSYGVGNYAVLNPLNIYNSAAGVISTATSNANLSVPTSSGQSWGGSSIAVTSGKWYAEFVFTVATDAQVGIYSSPLPTSTYYYQDPNAKTYNTDGQFWGPYPTTIQSYSSWTTGDIIAVALDLDNGKMWVSKNGAWQGGGDPAAGTSPAVSGISGRYMIGAGQGSNGSITANFGQRPFAYTPPSGYKSLCTYNLPTPTIQNGAGYMAATTYTGNGSTQSIVNTVNGASFQPDWVWIKCRSAGSTNHEEVDSVRGAGNTLYPNLTNSEGATNYTTLNSNGFSLVSTSAGNVNGNGSTYVAWQWKAGGTAVTNTAGSITSSVSANTTSGFSVVTYTGTGSNATVGHGLGVAPSMIIVKCRGINYEWKVWHTSLAVGNWLVLSNTGAAVYDPTNFTSTLPTSTVFNIGTNVGTNAVSTFVAYCFAAIPGYSAFGSYTGNGSTDGPFVYCGFRPRWVLIKDVTNANDWRLHDTSRSTYNAATNLLFPNLSNAETTYTDYSVDILSNGFKLRFGAGGGMNASGDTYVYACFAENPFTNALAR